MAVSEGRLFTIRLARSKAARESAYATIAKVGAWWVARIGGAQRGEVRSFATRAKAVAAIDEHYNAALFRQVVARRTHHG